MPGNENDNFPPPSLIGLIIHRAGGRAPRKAFLFMFAKAFHLGRIRGIFHPSRENCRRFICFRWLTFSLTLHCVRAALCRAEQFYLKNFSLSTLLSAHCKVITTRLRSEPFRLSLCTQEHFAQFFLPPRHSWIWKKKTKCGDVLREKRTRKKKNWTAMCSRCTRVWTVESLKAN